MSKKTRGLIAFASLIVLSIFLLNCGSSSSRPSGVLFSTSQGTAEVDSFAIDLDNGKLSEINTAAPTDTFPSDIVLDPSAGVLFVLNQGAGGLTPTITAYTVNSNGSVTKSGSSTPISVPNAVSMRRDKSGNFLIVASQGTIPPPDSCNPPVAGCPAISVFAIQSGSTSVTEVPGSPFLLQRVVSSAAPVDTPNGTLLYVTNIQDLSGTHNDNTVSVFNVDATGTITEVLGSPYTTTSAPTNALPVSVSPTGGSAALFVYVTNQTTNNIDIFNVCIVQNSSCTQTDVDNATMTLVGTPQSVGQKPTAMTVDPTNNFLYVLNHDSSTVSGFRINPTTGALTQLNPATVSVGANPFGIAMHPNGEFLYVSNLGTNNITGFIASTTTGALGTPVTVTTPAQPAGIVAK